jgi:hypothetical protein
MQNGLYFRLDETWGSRQCTLIHRDQGVSQFDLKMGGVVIALQNL